MLAGTRTWGADDGWTKEMPNAAQVMRDVKGTNARDTAARQIAAFNILTELADTRIGNLSANLEIDRLPPPERQLLQSYLDARTNIYKPIQAGFDPKCAGANCDSTSFPRLMANYTSSNDFRKQITDRYFDAQWMADFRRAAAAIAARNPPPVDQPAPQPVPTQGPPATDTGAVINQIIGGLAIWIPIGLVILWWRRRRAANRASYAAAVSKSASEAKAYPEVHARESSDAEMNRLGPDRQTRSRRIEELFNRRNESLEMDLDERNEQGLVGLKGKLVRSIAAMGPRERETLRAVYHLYNIGELAPRAFHQLRVVLIFGDGKAQVYNPQFASGGSVQDFASAVKNWNQLSSESAVSTVLHALERSCDRLPNDPTIKLLRQRLMGGGEQSLSGTAEFMAAQDPKMPGMIIGISEEDQKTVVYTGGRAVITIAPPGSGKTQCHVFPTLLTWKAPAVVLDVKGEIFAGTSKWRKENVGPVYKFSPLDPEHSASWNPLTTVRSNPNFLWEDSRFLADMMLVPSGAKDPFWENRARDVLTAAIARSCLNPDPAQRSLGDVLDVFHGIGWDKFIMSLQSAVDIRSMVRAGSSLSEMEAKTRDGVLQTGLSSLSAWDGDRLDRATRKSDWSPIDLRNSTNPPTIYMCLKPDEIDSYVSVLRVFIAQHLRALMSDLPPDEALPVLFMLDEMPRLKNMPPIVSALDLGRQYKVCPWMFAQSLGQLDDSYDKLAEGMVGSCAVRMYMNPSLHDETAQKLSDQIGLQEGVLDGTRQKIVEATALAGPEYKDYVIALAGGFQPFRVRKNFAYADPSIKSRMGSL